MASSFRSTVVSYSGSKIESRVIMLNIVACFPTILVLSVYPGSPSFFFFFFFFNMYMHIHIHAYTHIHIHIYIHPYTHTHIYIHIYIHIYMFCYISISGSGSYKDINEIHSVTKRLLIACIQKTSWYKLKTSR